MYNVSPYSECNLNRVLILHSKQDGQRFLACLNFYLWVYNWRFNLQTQQRRDNWFDPWLSQYSFLGLMRVIVIELISLSLLHISSVMVMKKSQWL